MQRVPKRALAHAGQRPASGRLGAQANRDRHKQAESAEAERTDGYQRAGAADEEAHGVGRHGPQSVAQSTAFMALAWGSTSGRRVSAMARRLSTFGAESLAAMWAGSALPAEASFELPTAGLAGLVCKSRCRRKCDGVGAHGRRSSRMKVRAALGRRRSVRVGWLLREPDRASMREVGWNSPARRTCAKHRFWGRSKIF